MAKVSIITVCFNSEKTIEATIKSVINQSYNNIEYIIIDGKSTDTTLNIINNYKDKISTVISEPDDGVYDAMNKGLALATGDIIGIINSDDCYEENTVERVVLAFNQYNCDVIHGDIIRVYDDMYLNIRCSPYAIKDIWHRTVFFHPTWFVKKSVYEKYGDFSTEFKIAGDYELLLRFYLNGVTFQYLKEDIVFYSMGGLSNKYTYLGYKEIRNASIMHGYSSIKANYYYYYRVFLRKIYDAVCFLKLKKIIEVYFKFKNT